MYYGARYYDPVLARFITADTVYDVGPQGLNRYSYALNNPIVYRDPTGHAIRPPGDPETAQQLILLGPTGMLVDKVTTHATEYYMKKANESYARRIANSSPLLPQVPVKAVGYLSLAGIVSAAEEVITLLSSGVFSFGAIIEESGEQIAKKGDTAQEIIEGMVDEGSEKASKKIREHTKALTEGIQETSEGTIKVAADAR